MIHVKKGKKNERKEGWVREKGGGVGGRERRREEERERMRERGDGICS
jgi:hypothetical protein